MSKRAARRRRRLISPEPAKLTWAERCDILDALSMVLDGVYAHLPLKRALYGFDIIRALDHLREQVPGLTDMQFHRELTTLVNRLRDAHTQYQGIWTGDDPIASLPFLVEAYGPPDKPVYVVSKVDGKAVKDRHFKEGVTIAYWNGIPFHRAVDMHAESETGGRPDARRARALESMTFRSLEYAPPPNEEWVVLGYWDAKCKLRELRLHWEGFDPERVATASHTVGSRIRRAINPAAEAVRRAKKYRFNRGLWLKETKADASGRAKQKRADPFGDFLSSRTVPTSHGKFGYLRIWSFDVDDDEAFLRAAIAHLRRLPQRGLIIDLRDNPGGFIWAAERMLQLFTPQSVLPTKFALRATPLTAAMAEATFNRQELAPWAESLATAQQTGEPYSSHLPITPVEACNDVGQHYSGPVVVVVDANTYSSGDLFTAGILDNRIGTVVCIGDATGAGGANVWEADDLRAALGAAGYPLPHLPGGARFTVAVRRAVRAGDADGTLIEDAGVPGQPYFMTQADVFHSNRDLIEHCAEMLAAQPRTQLDATVRGRSVAVKTAGLDRLDVTLDGHPACSSIVLKRDGQARRIALPARSRQVEIVGFSDNVIRQRRRLTLGKGR